LAGAAPVKVRHDSTPQLTAAFAAHHEPSFLTLWVPEPDTSLNVSFSSSQEICPVSFPRSRDRPDAN
jgi:hypothetical protein